MSVDLKIATKLTDKGYNALVANLKAMQAARVAVGLPNGSPPAANPDGKTAPGLTVAGLGIIHEYGSPENGIPARPFMKQTWDLHKAQTKMLIRHIYKKVLTFRTPLNQGLGQIGAFYEGRIKDTIVNGVFKANAPYTILKKGSSKPLIDTGLMRASVTFRVRPKG